MLNLPEIGFQPSDVEPYVRHEIFCDWVESSVAFADENLSQADVVDVLHQNSVYHDQDLATAQVKDAWIELRRREHCMASGASFKVNGRRIKRAREWTEVPAYSFCLLLSLQAWYKGWAKQFGRDFTQQGEMFERLTKECLDSFGWTTYRTGWSPGNAATIKQVVKAVAEHLGEPEVQDAIDLWIAEHAKEEGLDLVCSDEFPDERGGRPLYFFQCASGANWESKLHTPDPDTWRRIIHFTNIPKRGCAIPFALLAKEFRRKSGRVNGMMLDRYRLLAHAFYGQPDWLSEELSQDLLKWLRPRVNKLPIAS